MVRISAPPAGSSSSPTRNPLFATLAQGKRCYRLYTPSRFYPHPAAFRYNGPRARFDHHRGDSVKPRLKSAPDEEAVPILQPADDAERGVLYAGFTLSCCAVEVFGDLGVIECGDKVVTCLQTKRDLKLLDLSRGAMRAGVSAAISKRRHSMAQAWSRYFYENPAFQNTDGILYNNAHNDEKAVMFYERAEEALEVVYHHRLDSARYRRSLMKISLDHSLPLSFEFFDGG